MKQRGGFANRCARNDDVIIKNHAIASEPLRERCGKAARVFAPKIEAFARIAHMVLRDDSAIERGDSGIALERMRDDCRVRVASFGFVIDSDAINIARQFGALRKKTCGFLGKQAQDSAADDAVFAFEQYLDFVVIKHAINAQIADCARGWKGRNPA